MNEELEIRNDELRVAIAPYHFNYILQHYKNIFFNK